MGEEDFSTKLLPELKQLLNLLLESNSSVLYGVRDYKIFVMSEHIMKRTSMAHRKNLNFTQLENAFSPEHFELRVNRAEYIEDLDIMASADVFITARCSKYPAFIERSLLSRHSALLHREKCSREDMFQAGNPIAEKIWKDVMQTQNFDKFNRQMCPFTNVESIDRNCKTMQLDAA